MSSLREKAKPLVEIIKKSCSYVYLTRCKDCVAQCEFEGTSSFAGLWVRLEDAQQEIERIHRKYEGLISKAEKDCADCYQDLKQKLQQFAKYLDCFVLIPPIKPKFYEIFGKLLEKEETKMDFVKGKIIMKCPKCAAHAPNLTSEGCPECGFKPEVKKVKPTQKEIKRVDDELQGKLAKAILKYQSYEHELLELKQKLRQLLTEFPSKDGGSPANWRVNMYSTREVDEWKKKFEELLKEEK